jgi:hypothetical protein
MTDTGPPNPTPALAAPAPKSRVWVAARQGTSVTVGVVVLAWDRVTGPATRPTRGQWWRNVTVGALFEAEDAASGLLSGIGRKAGDYRRLSARGAGAAVLRVTDRLSRLAAQGAAETERSRRAATAAAEAVTRMAATSTPVNRAVDAQLDRVVRPLVATVLDDVLATLAAEPERVRSLVRDQRETITDDVVDRIRASATAGDAAVQGTVARLLARARGASNARAAKPATPAALAASTGPP